MDSRTTMKDPRCVLFFIVTTFLFCGHSHCKHVVLTDNGPAVLGANITLTARVFTESGELAIEKYKYHWRDNAVPVHTHEDETSNAISQWTVSYPSPRYQPGSYEISVTVDTWFFLASLHQNRSIQITDALNGDLRLSQNATGVVTNSLVSSKQPVIHTVVLSEPDLDFLKTSATHVATYWFVDCVYYGQSPDFGFNYTFRDVGADHDIEALIIASFDKPVPTTPAPITTTAAPTTAATPTTTALNLTTLALNTSTAPQNLTVENVTVAPVVSNASFPSTTPSTPTGSTPLAPPPFNASQFICVNTTIFPRVDNKTYGHFHKRISVRAPVENLTYIGTNWVQPGDLLSLQVYCNGSSNFDWCHYEETQDYNVTGNETCFVKTTIANCSFLVSHLPRDNITLIIIVKNDVSKGVLGVKINLYSVQKRSQLSVVIVPITCSMIAVVLIVFGIAYYVQSRARFTVEIADFDFGQSDDLEYKTFRERLFDAVNNAVNRVEVLDEENTSAGQSPKYLSLP